MTDSACDDRIALDAWYVVAAVDELPLGGKRSITLLGARLEVTRGVGGKIVVSHDAGEGALPVALRFGYLDHAGRASGRCLRHSGV